MKVSKFLTVAAATASMLAASSAYAAAPVAAKLSVASAQSLRVGGIEKRSVNRNSFRSFITNPLVIAGVVATAIAVPLAISNSDNPSSP